jgi:hypothetical protein
MMTLEETGKALGRIALHDHRNLGETPHERQLMLTEWHTMIGENSYGDVMNAIVEFRKTRPGVWLEFGHINQLCKAYREERARQQHHEALTAPDRADYPTFSRQVDHMLMKAWNDPVLYAVAEAKLNEELVDQGFAPVYDSFLGLSPVGSGIDESRKRGRR